MAQHEEERCALALLTANAWPDASMSDAIDWAAALIQRGADVHARYIGSTPLQHWCDWMATKTAAAVILLLEARADFEASHPHGETALWTLCNNASALMLRELSKAGWLDTVDFDLPGVNGEAPIACLKRKLAALPGSASDEKSLEMIELLSAMKQRWQQLNRPLVLALLEEHEQLVPDLAELIVSYIDGGKAGQHAGAAAAASS